MKKTEDSRPEKLSQLRVEGFRSIRQAEITFSNATVLVGANGAGKSNLIGFLQMLSYMMSENLSLFVNERRGANSLLHYGSERTHRLVGQLEFHSDAGNVTSTYDFTLVPAAGDRLLFTREDLKFRRDDSDSGYLRGLEPGGWESAVPKAAKRSEASDLRRVSRIFQNRLREVKVYHFHNTSSISAIRGFQDLRENRSLLAQGSNLAVMLQVIRDHYGNHYGRIVEEMRQILPGFLDFVLEPDPSRGREQMELRWTNRFGTATFGPDQLSDGSIRAAALLTLLLQPEELKPGIIVIDEPELGLHPFAVGQIARLINEAAVHRQIIVSTQSSRLLSEFEPEQVVVVEAPNGESEFRALSKDVLSSWLEEYDDLGTLFEMNVTGGAPI